MHKPKTITLRLAANADDDLDLPVSTFVTSTNAILGKKRGGKTYKGGVFAEELLEANQQIVIVDPTSAWWGLRSSSDGRFAGYPITIFGGEHGDLPLEATAGAEIADAIVADRFSAILDLSNFSRAEEQRFCAAFLDRLYRKNKKAMHLFLDEADIYAPQRPVGDEMKSLSACQSIVLRGGIKGIGITMITQRPARLNKDVLSQVDMLTLLKVSYHGDLDAIGDWVKEHGDKDTIKELRESLPTLKRGDAWLWAPSSEIFGRLTFRDKTTYDSSRTPEAGEVVEPPKVLAKVDLERLGEVIAATAKVAKDNDPKALRARVAELEARLERIAKLPTAGPQNKIDLLQAKLDKANDELDEERRWSKDMEDIIEQLSTELDHIADRAINTRNGIIDKIEDAAGKANRIGDLVVPARLGLVATAPHRRPIELPKNVTDAISTGKVFQNKRVNAAVDANGLSRLERALLFVLAQRGDLLRKKILIHADYQRSGNTNKAFARLLREGWITTLDDDTLSITQEGLKALGRWEPLPTGAELRAKISNDLKRDLERKIFDTVCSVYPHAIGRTEVLARIGYQRSGNTNKAFGKLIAHDYFRPVGRGSVIATEELFQ